MEKQCKIFLRITKSTLQINRLKYTCKLTYKVLILSLCIDYLCKRTIMNNK